MKYVTIATDISHCDINNITTWACYIRHNGGTIKEVHEFKDNIATTLIAETLALANALVIAENNIPYWKEARVIIYNEIDRCLDPTPTRHNKTRDAVRRKAISNVSLPVLDRADSWELRKVEAHYKEWKTSPNIGRYIMNQWCDEESRSLLRRLRDNR